MRESRTYGSVRGACDETHVPTATAARVHHAARRRGGGVAARGARAAARPNAAHRRADGARREDAESQLTLAAFRQDSRSSGGLRAATSRSTLAGRAVDDDRAGNDTRGTRRAAARRHSHQNTPPLHRMLQQTRTIPSYSRSLPIRSAAVSSRAWRGRAATSPVSQLWSRRLRGKWLELLKEIAPRVDRTRVLFNPTTAPYCRHLPEPIQGRGPSLGVEAIAALLATIRDRTVIAAQSREPNGGLIVIRRWLPERPSRGDRHAGGSLSPACRLSVPFLR